MKATELMLGDIVKLDGKTMKVVEIYGNTRVPLTSSCRLIGEYGSYSTGEVDPVPLTDEILEANGWEIIWDFTDYKYYRHRKMKSDVKCKKNPGIYVLRTIHFCYVHEFQHLLRLCRKEDLADNFKIK